MASHAGRQQHPYEFDGPYIPLPRPRGSALPAGGNQPQGWWVGGEWIEARSDGPPKRKQQSHLPPIIIEDDDDSDCYEVPPPAPRPTHSGQSARVFDFNDGSQDVPWATRAQHGRTYEVSGRSMATKGSSLTVNAQPRSFTDSADDELLAYLADRSISRGFLVEIDQFFRSHPEIAHCPEGRETIRQLNSSSPLEAYRYFLRGYTRPAR
jgi:hypothetical protein